MRDTIEADEKLESGPAVRSQSDLAAKPPSDSRTSIHYPFSSNARLRESYVNPWGNHVRYGKILEDLDALAGNIALKHTRQSFTRPLVLVTASVDRIALHGSASIEQDLTMEGAVTWTGSSSMEIGMTARCAEREHVWVSANFTFVGRNPASGASALINSIEPVTDAERSAYEAAAARQAEKRERRVREAKSVGGRTPMQHRLIRELLQKAEPLKRMPALADRGSILMYKTALSNALTCQLTHQNTHGRVFGGFLMRKAFELAFATAHLFSGGRPVILEVDDVAFKKPVSIGDLLQFESIVLYTRQRDFISGKRYPQVHVEVTAIVSDPSTQTSSVTNTFNFTFAIPDKVRVLDVIPATEGEAARMVKMMELDDAQERGEV